MMPVDLAAGNVMALGIMVQGAGPVPVRNPSGQCFGFVNAYTLVADGHRGRTLQSG